MYRVTVSGQVVAVGMDEMPVKPHGVSCGMALV